MPFGLSNSPTVFQTLVNDVLRDVVNRFVFVYVILPGPHHHTERVSNPGCGRSNKERQRLQPLAPLFWGQGSEVYTQPLLAYIRYIYLDDILIFSQNERDHIQHVRLVLQRLLENRVFAKLEKCEFHARSVQFLGFILSPEGIRMDPSKVEAVANWPTPDNRKAVQRFLGFANFYRRFIRGFSAFPSPIIRFNPFWHKSKTTSSERKNVFAN